MRTQLLWRILDDPTLPMEWHNRLFQFVLAEWDTFQASSVKFLGPSHELVIIRALERYGDPSFPTEKKWAYLCSGAGATSYAKAARALLAIGQQCTDPFIRNVANTLLARQS